jgi:hypothetical protein
MASAVCPLRPAADHRTLGTDFVGEALLDTFLLYHIPTIQWVVIHPLLFGGIVVVAFGGAILFSRQVLPKTDASLRQMAQEQEALAGRDRPEASQISVGRTGSVCREQSRELTPSPHAPYAHSAS